MAYELSDNPHPIGTKEHRAWVVDTYIPSLTEDQIDQHRKRAGAESIGGRLIVGQRPTDAVLPPPYVLAIDRNGRLINPRNLGAS
jgi:hypothetical protein